MITSAPSLDYGAATNLCTNGGFETNTTGWTAAGTNTIARSTEQAKHGSASLKCTYQDNAQMANFAYTFSEAGAYSGSLWVYIPSDFDAGNLNVRFDAYAGATGTLIVAADLDIKDAWQRVSIPDVGIVAGDLIGTVLQVRAFTAAPTAGRFIYIDGGQVEAGATPTPYVETDGGAASRAATAIALPTRSLGGMRRHLA